MRAEKNKTTDNFYSPQNPKSYSVDEILSGGGATAFANKLGKNAKGIITSLSSLPNDAFLTDDELKDALVVLNENK